MDIRTKPRTIEAIANFSLAAFGRPSLLITPGQASLRLLNQALPVALGVVNIGQAVGRGAPNSRADVQQVQDRLQSIGILAANHHQQETVANQNNVQNIQDNAIPETINAISRFNIELVGVSLHQIRPDSREEQYLNNPPRFRQQMLNVDAGVGANQPNPAAEVRAVQDRLLGLTYLTVNDHAAEAVNPNNPPNPNQIPDNQIPHTIAAIRSFQLAMGLNNNGMVTRGSETLRLLIRPSLPVARNLNLASPVGVGPRHNLNQRPAVRSVQDRLQELGFLSTNHYLNELADSSVQGNIAPNQIPHTIEAIRSFQSIVVGTNDGNIDPGGKTERTLNDPTYGTLTSFNLEAANPQAGVAFSGAQGAQLNRVIQAIEQHEAGNRTGEAPADLINAAGVPASYGSAQMIGATALGVLRQPGNQQLRDYYGLNMATLNMINNRATETGNRYNQIIELVPVGGESEANLQARIANYIQQNGSQFRADTGLSNQDLTNIFRFGQIRRRILAATSYLPDIATNPNTWAASHPNAPTVNNLVQVLLNNQDFLISYNALGFNRSSLQAYVRNRRSMGENRAGFMTKAIFSHPESQRIRNAMTDASGRSIGRMSIREVFNTANGLVPAGQANRDRVVAARTARGHNSGANHINDALVTIMADPYVVNVLHIWDGLQALQPQQQGQGS